MINPIIPDVLPTFAIHAGFTGSIAALKRECIAETGLRPRGTAKGWSVKFSGIAA